MGRRALISVPKADGLPVRLFFNTSDERISLARQRFFEQGELPSGLVPDTVTQSWARCLRSGMVPLREPTFEPVSRGRVLHALERHRPLLDASCAELDRLDRVLHGVGCKAVLMDASSILLRTTPPALDDRPLLRAASRVGVSLDEKTIGTGANNLAASTGRTATVSGAEHYCEPMQSLRCAASPILGSGDTVVGILCLTIEGRPWPFDAVALLRASAASIENRLLERQASHRVVIRFQTHPGLFGTPMEGLAGSDDHDALRWVNACGRSLLGEGLLGRLASPSFEAVFGSSLPKVLDRTRSGPIPLQVCNGMLLWVQAREHALEHKERLEASPRQTETTPVLAVNPLHDVQREMIETTLTQHHGNVTKTARALGVSRNFLYRRLHRWAES